MRRIGLVALVVAALSVCTAIGGRAANGATASIASTSVWTIQPMPDPSSGNETLLQSVSCSSITWCVAVGFSYTSSDPAAGGMVVEAWNGTDWSLQSPPLPTGWTWAALFGVSCVSATHCIAVGEGADGTDSHSLAEKWNGTDWTVMATPTPPGEATGSLLYSVSCSTWPTCTAVGWYEASVTSPSAQLAEVWDGTSWKLQTLPLLAGSSYSALHQVSCPSVETCTAVGNYAGRSQTALVEVENATGWMIQPSPSLPIENQFDAVSCATAASCMAIGFAGAHSLSVAETWNGAMWTVVKTAKPRATLSGVSCPSTSTCIAVGYNTTATTPSGEYAVSESWNGTTWTAHAVASPPAASGSNLDSVSCPTTTTCFAVGSSWTDDFLPLAEEEHS